MREFVLLAEDWQLPTTCPLHQMRWPRRRSRRAVHKLWLKPIRMATGRRDSPGEHMHRADVESA